VAEVTPLWSDASPAAAASAGRYEALAARAEGLAPRFARSFTTRLYALEDGDSVSLTQLEDDFHLMRVSLRIGPDGAIREAAGRMDRHPYDSCPRALESLAHLEGLSLVVPGASARTKERVPRVEGCLHVIDMLHIAYRAFWISKGHDVPYEGDEGRRRLLTLLPHMRDTCVSFAVKR
jgi:hypothetical protein